MLQRTGTTDLVADALSRTAAALPPYGAIALIIVAAMAVTPFPNNAALGPFPGYLVVNVVAVCYLVLVIVAVFTKDEKTNSRSVMSMSSTNKLCLPEWLKDG
jgi:uncharacterized membrane protein